MSPHLAKLSDHVGHVVYRPAEEGACVHMKCAEADISGVAWAQSV
jgi:hypothetical protein